MIKIDQQNLKHAWITVSNTFFCHSWLTIVTLFIVIPSRYGLEFDLTSYILTQICAFLSPASSFTNDAKSIVINAYSKYNQYKWSINKLPVQCNYENHDRPLNQNIFKYEKNEHLKKLYDTMGAFRQKKTMRQDGRIRAESCATFGKIVRHFPQSHR